MANKIIGAICIIFVAISLFFIYLKKESIIIVGGKTFIMGVADTPRLQERGLSNVVSISPDQGMIFVFATPSVYGFWMKDMNFPLDIIWISNDQKIVWIEKNVATSTYPNVLYPKSPAKYVLEISSGQADVLNIKIGDQIIIKNDYFINPFVLK